MMRSTTPKTNNIQTLGSYDMEDSVADVDGLPTTPVQKTPVRGFSGENALTTVVLLRSAAQLKVHPHGLSARKQLEDCVSPQGSPGGLENEWLDKSLDCVRRSKEEVQQPNALERIDINRMFSMSQDQVEGGIEDPALRVNHSPMRLDMSSPIKANGGREDGGPEPKRLKLEMECVPSLPKPSGGKGDEEHEIGSPELIEMIDTKSSPMREFSQAECGEVGEGDGPSGGLLGTPKRRISSLHTLTPIHQDIDDIDRLENGAEMSEGFYMITDRNEELIKQVHLLNQKLNKMMTSCEVAFFHYKKVKVDYDSLAAECEHKLTKSAKEAQILIEERDKFRERANRLKVRIDESTDEFHMLKQNSSILQSKYETLVDETEASKKRESELDLECSSLKGKISNHMREFQLLQEKMENVTTQLHEVSADSLTLRNDNQKLKEHESTLREKLEAKNDELERLQRQLDETKNAEQGANNEILAQLNDVIGQRTKLEAEFEAFRAFSEMEGKNLKNQVHEAESRSNLVVKELQDLKSHSTSLQEELDSKVSEMEQMSKVLEELNDDVEIGKAEVKELQNDKIELEQTKECLESSVAELEESVRVWQKKCQEQEGNEKISLELESIQLKNSNIEAEHLAELEQLHSNLSSLQDALKENSHVISDLKNVNEELREDHRMIEKKYQETLEKVSQDSNHRVEESLRKEVAAWKDKYQAKEQESNKSLKLLAEDLYIQYSSKHEQKVKLLKKGYETKFQGKLDKITLQNEGLTQEVDFLKTQLASERKEKQKLLEVLETRK